MSSITIIIPNLPWPQLNPNAREYHKRKNTYFQSAKEGMTAQIREQGLRQDPLWELVELEFIFHAKDRRRRDVDNLLAACKAWVDALIGEVITHDDGFHVRKISGEYKKGEKACTELNIYNIK